MGSCEFSFTWKTPTSGTATVVKYEATLDEDQGPFPPAYKGGPDPPRNLWVRQEHKLREEQFPGSSGPQSIKGLMLYYQDSTDKTDPLKQYELSGEWNPAGVSGIVHDTGWYFVASKPCPLQGCNGDKSGGKANGNFVTDEHYKNQICIQRTNLGKASLLDESFKNEYHGFLMKDGIQASTTKLPNSDFNFALPCDDKAGMVTLASPKEVLSTSTKHGISVQ